MTILAELWKDFYVYKVIYNMVESRIEMIFKYD